MTQKEIAEYLGLRSVTLVNSAFKKAEKESPTIAAKVKQYNRLKSRDYTKEEFLIALKYFDLDRMVLTLPMIQFFLENYIERDTPYKEKKKRSLLTASERRFIDFYRLRGREYQHKCCANCLYITPRGFEGVVRYERPYCMFYECFLHKVKPKRDIYFDYCPTFRKSNREPYLYLQTGPVLVSQYGKENTSMAGIPQSEFKSTRAKGEPIYILRDCFEDAPVR